MKLFKLFAVISALFMLSACGEIVDTGHRGVETKYGKVTSESLPEGFYFYMPFVTNITEMDTRVQRLDLTDQTYTRDVQEAKVGYTVNINLKRDKVHVVFQEVGKNWQEKLVEPVLKNAVKTAIGKWDAVDLVANREKATKDIVDTVRKALDQKNIELVGFELTDIQYRPEFETAVEAKQVAIQKAIESQNKTVQVQEEAKQKVITAEAEAEAMRIQSDALKQSKNLVEWKAVEKWNGVLPVYMLGEGTTPFINLDKK